MNDLISRQAAIAEFSCCELTPDGGIDANYAIDFLKYMPSAQPEWKKGKWIQETKHYKDDEQEYYYYEEHCSNCGVKREIGWRYASFCPNCGADMRGEQDA